MMLKFDSPIILPLILSLIPMICWGTMDFLGSRMAKQTNAIIGLFLAQFLGLLMLFPLIPFIKEQLSQPLTIFIVALFPFLAWISYLKATKKGIVSVLGPVSRTGFLVSSFLGIIFLQEHITTLKLISFILILCGGLFLTFEWKSIKKIKQTRLFSGVPLALLAAILIGINLFFTAPLSRINGWYYTTLVSRLGVTLYSLVFLLLSFKSTIGPWKQFPWKISLGIALVDVIGLGVYNFAVTRYEVSYVSVIASCATLVTIVLARLFLKEKLTKIQIISVITMLLGIIFLQKSA
jgi:drug/metabolite transporter (DMT)-like permease